MLTPLSVPFGILIVLLILSVLAWALLLYDLRPDHRTVGASIAGVLAFTLFASNPCDAAAGWLWYAIGCWLP